MASFKGAKKHSDRLKKLSGAAVVKLAGAIAFEGADTIRAEAFRSISAGSISGKNHVASKPGEAPNRDAGDLQSGLKIYQTGPTTAEFRAEAAHSAPLEFGSERKAGFGARSFAGVKSPFGPSKIKSGPIKVEFGDSTTAARPFMRPARDTKEEDIRKRFVEQMNKLVKASG